MNPPTNKRR